MTLPNSTCKLLASSGSECEKLYAYACALKAMEQALTEPVCIMLYMTSSVLNGLIYRLYKLQAPKVRGSFQQKQAKVFLL
jgi:hypothetical protein